MKKRITTIAVALLLPVGLAHAVNWGELLSKGTKAAQSGLRQVGVTDVQSAMDLAQRGIGKASQVRDVRSAMALGEQALGRVGVDTQRLRQDPTAIVGMAERGLRGVGVDTSRARAAAERGLQRAGVSPDMVRGAAAMGTQVLRQTGAMDAATRRIGQAIGLDQRVVEQAAQQRALAQAEAAAEEYADNLIESVRKLEEIDGQIHTSTEDLARMIEKGEAPDHLRLKVRELHDLRALQWAEIGQLLGF